MPYELLSGAEALERIRDAWRDLEQRVPCRMFQTYSFARLWYHTVGVAVSARPHIVVYSEGDRVMGIFPACRMHEGFVPLLTWLGGPTLLDSGDVVFDGTAEIPVADFVTESLRLLLPQRRGALLYLSNVRDDAAVHPVLEGRLRRFKSAPAPYITVLPDFERMVANIPGDRKQVRQKERRLQRAGDVGFEMLDASSPGIGDAMDWLIEQKKVRYGHGRMRADLFLPGHEEFRRAQILEQPGMLLARLTLDGVTLAECQVCIHNGSMYGILTAFDPEASYYSPGVILQLYLLKYCCERGVRTLDMGWGGGQHKYTWTDTDVTLTTYVSNDLLGRSACIVRDARERFRAMTGRAKKTSGRPVRAPQVGDTP